jgi:hypothetical protein
MVFVISIENNKISCSSLKSGNKCLNIEIPIIWKKIFKHLFPDFSELHDILLFSMLMTKTKYHDKKGV